MAANPNATLPDFVRDLAYTVVAGGVYFENAFTGRSVKALNGVELRLSGFGTGTIKVNNARVVRSDVFTSNGVLHILDRYVASTLQTYLPSRCTVFVYCKLTRMD